MKRSLCTALLGIVLLAMGGCKTDPAKARDAIAAAGGFLTDVQTKHLVACRADPKQPVCVKINQAGAVQRLAATTLNEFCAGPPLAGDATYATGGPCSEQAGVEPRLEAALRDLNSIMIDVKKIGGN